MRLPLSCLRILVAIFNIIVVGNLTGLADENESVRDAALGAGHVLVEHYATTYNSDYCDHIRLLIIGSCLANTCGIVIHIFGKSIEIDERHSIKMNIEVWSFNII